MPTTITHTVIASGGGDYSTLSAWESAQQRNLVSADEIARALCSSTGAADETGVVVSGFTTDATRYVLVESAQAHNGVWNTSIYRLVSPGTALNFADNNCKVFNLQIESSATASDCLSLSGGAFAAHYEVDNLLIRNTSGAVTSTQSGIEMGWCEDVSSGFRVKNCIIYDCYNGVYRGQNRRGHIHNVTVQNCVEGFINAASGDGWRLKNCLAQDCTDGFDGGAGGWHGDSTNNCSDIASDAPGSNPSTGEVTFTNEGSDDFTLSASDTVAKDLGADLSADADYAVADDIAGTARPQGSAYDIGASEAPTVVGARRSFAVI